MYVKTSSRIEVIMIEVAAAKCRLAASKECTEVY